VSASRHVAFANRRVSEISGIPFHHLVEEANARVDMGLAPPPLRDLILRGLAGEVVRDETIAFRRFGGGEIALRCSMTPELLAAIVESSDDAIITRDLAGQVVSWNAGAERMYGYPAEEVVGRVLDAHFLDADDGGIPLDYANGLAAFPGRRRVVRRRRKDGSLLDVEVHVFPVTDTAGEVVRFAGVSHDITERLRAESELARLAAIVDFTFNLGAGRLQTSTLRRRINQRDWSSAGQELRRWVYLISDEVQQARSVSQ
jgi:PAS domain S-box-containing protein